MRKNLLLIPYDGIRQEAVEWYQNPQLQQLANGTKEAYSWQTIGDVWLAKDDFAILLSPDYQKQGIATCILSYFLRRLRAEGAKEMRVKEVYDYNKGSQRLFESLGFRRQKKENKVGYVYFF